jgi:hypothetical protein
MIGERRGTGLLEVLGKRAGRTRNTEQEAPSRTLHSPREDCMKRSLALLVVAFILTPILVLAQKPLVESGFSSGLEGWTAGNGSWAVKGGRLVQSDVKDGMTKCFIKVPQSGVMRYEFDVLYVDGAEQDGYGAFGIHVFVDSLIPSISWGNGNSCLFWVTFDPKAYGVDKAGGTAFYGQIYKSTTNVNMNLAPGKYSHIAIPAMSPANGQPWMTWIYPRGNYVIPNPNIPVKVKIDVDADKGEAKVWDPVYDGYYYLVPLDKASLKAGNYVILRTSSVAMSFDNVKITKLQ